MGTEETGSPIFALGICPIPISLYIHIPFCIHKCDYCDFYSEVTSDKELINRVLREEVRRIELSLSALSPPSVQTLYIGGGTPSFLPLDQLEQFLERVFSMLPNIPPEATIEANPDSLSPALLQLLGSFPINRLSVGVQTFKEPSLRVLNRTTSGDLNRTALRSVQDYWKGNLNIDLLYGVPGQAVKDLEEDIREILLLHPQHLSLYQLTLEPGTKIAEQIRRGAFTTPSPQRIEAMERSAKGLIASSGYLPYEISNYAIPGYECKHNLRYWQLRPYLGVGPSAVSTLPGKDNKILRITEIADLHSKEELFASTEVEVISPPVLLKDLFLMGLRTVYGIADSYFNTLFSLTISEVIPRTLERYHRYIEYAEGRFSLNERGREILNQILIDIFTEIDEISFPIQSQWPSD